jgi:hypothetical protein
MYYMTWAYARLGHITDTIIETEHMAMASENHVDIAPVSTAMRALAASEVHIRLLEKDEEHPSVAGTYLAGLVIYFTLYRHEGTVADAIGFWPAELCEADALAVQRAARTVVSDPLWHRAHDWTNPISSRVGELPSLGPASGDAS